MRRTGTIIYTHKCNWEVTAVADSLFDSADCSYKFSLPSSKAYCMLIARAVAAWKRLNNSKAGRKEK